MVNFGPSRKFSSTVSNMKVDELSEHKRKNRYIDSCRRKQFVKIFFLALKEKTGKLVWNSRLIETWAGVDFFLLRKEVIGLCSLLDAVQCTWKRSQTGEQWASWHNSAPQRTLVDQNHFDINKFEHFTTILTLLRGNCTYRVTFLNFWCGSIFYGDLEIKNINSLSICPSFLLLGLSHKNQGQWQNGWSTDG